MAKYIPNVEVTAYEHEDAFTHVSKDFMYISYNDRLVKADYSRWNRSQNKVDFTLLENPEAEIALLIMQGYTKLVKYPIKNFWGWGKLAQLLGIKRERRSCLL